MHSYYGKIKKKEDTVEDVEKQFFLGTWGNETAFSKDDIMKFSMAYYTESVEAVFDHNVFRDAANPEDLELIEGYVYQITYYLDREAGTIEAKHSQEFFDALTSNATEGILKKVD